MLKGTKLDFDFFFFGKPMTVKVAPFCRPRFLSLGGIVTEERTKHSVIIYINNCHCSTSTANCWTCIETSSSLAPTHV